MCQQAVVPVCLHKAARTLLALTAESREICLFACVCTHGRTYVSTFL